MVTKDGPLVHTKEAKVGLPFVEEYIPKTLDEATNKPHRQPRPVQHKGNGEQNENRKNDKLSQRHRKRPEKRRVARWPSIHNGTLV